MWQIVNCLRNVVCVLLNSECIICTSTNFIYGCTFINYYKCGIYISLKGQMWYLHLTEYCIWGWPAAQKAVRNNGEYMIHFAVTGSAMKLALWSNQPGPILIIEPMLSTELLLANLFFSILFLKKQKLFSHPQVLYFLKQREDACAYIHSNRYMHHARTHLQFCTVPNTRQSYHKHEFVLRRPIRVQLSLF